ncbi:MAG: histidine kinase [Bacteroidales bacterium]|nr:histidine kinase [Bacteroidales bacterium]
MQKGIFLHNIWFRITAPVVAGFLAYLLVLLFFDSLTNLSENILGQELLFTVLLSCVFFEGQHLLLAKISNLKSYTESIEKTVFLQISSGLAVTVFIVSGVMGFYFSIILGYSKFVRELLVFNSIFIVFSIVYHLVYFSIILLQFKNEDAIAKEIKNRDAVLSELQAFQNDLRPEIFYSSFESLLILVHTDKRRSEKYLSVFSEVYRYILDAKRTELVEMQDEIKHLKNLIFLLNHQYNNDISVSFSAMNNQYMNKIVPCTLQVILEYIISENIVNKEIPLNIELSASDGVLMIKYDSVLKLNATNNLKEINDYSRKLEYFTGNCIKHGVTSDNGKIIQVPLISGEIVEATDEEI